MRDRKSRRSAAGLWLSKWARLGTLLTGAFLCEQVTCQKHCRRVLTSVRKTKFSPMCLRGDILGRCPSKLQDRVEHLRQQAIKVVKAVEGRGKPKDSAAVLEVL